MKNSFFAITRAVLTALAILTGAIAIPILLRPFYWLHIAPLNIPETMGLSVAQIKEAYGQMLDYCMGLSNTFSVGVLPYSQSGAAHFADVRKLFVLDLAVFVISAAALTVLHFRFRDKGETLAGHTPGFWSTVGLGVSAAVVGIFAAVDFDKAFTVFHKIVFPGKTNWGFNPRRDPVIDMLPVEFFRNCAIFIFLLILTSCGFLLVRDFRQRKKQ